MMQWVWQQTGYSYLIYDDRLAGTEYIYLDPTLPDYVIGPGDRVSVDIAGYPELSRKALLTD